MSDEPVFDGPAWLRTTAFEALAEYAACKKRGVSYPTPKPCLHCGQPMRPPGVPKRPNEYDHAQGCPYGRKRQKGARKPL
jgi:hypothetical protein